MTLGCRLRNAGGLSKTVGIEGVCKSRRFNREQYRPNADGVPREQVIHVHVWLWELKVAVLTKESKTLSLNLEQKQAVVAEVSAEVAQAQAIVVAEYRGLPVGNMTELRKRARASGVYLRVLKNTLARRAVAETPFAGLADKLVGPLVYGISADPVAVAKVLHEFAKENVDKFVIKGGAMPNSVMTPRAGRAAREDAEPRTSCSPRSRERCRRRSRSSRAP